MISFHRHKLTANIYDNFVFFLDPDIHAYCILYYDKDGDGLCSKKDIASITSREFTTNCVFDYIRNKKNIYFNEFLYFTGIISFNLDGLQYKGTYETITLPYNLKSYIPQNIKKLYITGNTEIYTAYIPDIIYLGPNVLYYNRVILAKEYRLTTGYSNYFEIIDKCLWSKQHDILYGTWQNRENFIIDNENIKIIKEGVLNHVSVNPNILNIIITNKCKQLCEIGAYFAHGKKYNKLDIAENACNNLYLLHYIALYNINTIIFRGKIKGIMSDQNKTLSFTIYTKPEYILYYNDLFNKLNYTSFNIKSLDEYKES